MIALSDLVIEVWGLPLPRMFAQGSYKGTASSSSSKHHVDAAGRAGGVGRHPDAGPGGADGSSSHGELPTHSIFLGAVNVSCWRGHVRTASCDRWCEEGTVLEWVSLVMRDVGGIVCYTTIRACSPVLPLFCTHTQHRSLCSRPSLAPAVAAGSCAGTACSGAQATKTSQETCRCVFVLCELPWGRWKHVLSGPLTHRSSKRLTAVA